ncbi:MAG TPA: DUF2304 domain-containing protein [bacterium]|nr:DUF2304 domain-containing protein [bacterium]
MLIQILITLFSLFALSKVLKKFKKQTLKKSEFGLWFVFWILTAVLVWLPGSLTKIANFLGIGRGADLIFYASLILIFYLIFRIYLKLEKIEKHITKIVRKNTLDEIDKK